MLNYVVDPRLIAPLYVAVPMRHEIEHLDGSVKVEYSWRCGRKRGITQMNAAGESQPIPAGSNAEFITEHLLGSHGVAQRLQRISCGTSALENLDAIRFGFEADVAALYGEQFADGSPITVQKRQILP